MAERKVNHPNLKSTIVHMGAVGVVAVGAVELNAQTHFVDNTVSKVGSASHIALNKTIGEVSDMAFAKLGLKPKDAEAQTPPPNLIQNPSFETPENPNNTPAGLPQNWVLDPAFSPDSFANYHFHSGTPSDGLSYISADIVGVNGSCGESGYATSTDIPFDISKTYDLKFYVMSTNNVNVIPLITVVYDDINGSMLGFDQKSFSSSNSWAISSHKVGVAGEFTPAPAGTKNIKIGFDSKGVGLATCTDGTNYGTVSFDAVSFAEDPPPSVGGIAQEPDLNGLPVATTENQDSGFPSQAEEAVAAAAIAISAVGGTYILRRKSSRK